MNWKNERKGFTLVEILVVIAIITMLMALLGFVIGPAIKASGTKTTCASNMKQIITAFQLYAADHDGQLQHNGGDWKGQAMATYLHADPKALFCPKSFVYHGSPWSSYRDENAWGSMQALRTSEEERTLPNGKYSPWFNQDVDALLKCVMHGKDGHMDAQSTMMVPDESQPKGSRVLTAYFDGRVVYAPHVVCWELPWLMRVPANRQRTDLMQFCDGVLEDKK